MSYLTVLRFHANMVLKARPLFDPNGHEIYWVSALCTVLKYEIRKSFTPWHIAFKGVLLLNHCWLQKIFDSTKSNRRLQTRRTFVKLPSWNIILSRFHFLTPVDLHQIHRLLVPNKAQFACQMKDSLLEISCSRFHD